MYLSVEPVTERLQREPHSGVQNEDMNNRLVRKLFPITVGDKRAKLETREYMLLIGEHLDN